MICATTKILFHCEECRCAVFEDETDWDTDGRDLCGDCVRKEGQEWLDREVNVWLRAPSKEQHNA